MGDPNLDLKLRPGTVVLAGACPGDPGLLKPGMLEIPCQA
jgi:hypothetical protein